MRSGATPSPRRSAERECSPAHSTYSLASDLGIPPEIVNSSGGVNLASVAPPPADLDIKPVITQSLPAYTPSDSGSSLEVENANLKQRVRLLENIVKELAALSSLNTGAPQATEQKPAETLTNLDWDVNTSPTISPPLFPSEPFEALEPLPSAQTEIQPDLNLACHPAVMATSPCQGQALQRARNTSVSAPLEMNLSRLGVAAKVIIALAKLRGLASLSRPSLLTWKTTSQGLQRRQRQRLRRSRMDIGGTRQVWRTTGMRG